MIDWNLLETPANFPHACIGCKGGKGPVVATHTNWPGVGDIYLCEECSKRAATVFGFAPGKRMEELGQASKKLGNLERVHVEDQAKITRQAELIAIAERVHEEDKEVIATLRQRVGQLEDRLRDEAAAALELVNG